MESTPVKLEVHDSGGKRTSVRKSKRPASNQDVSVESPDAARLPQRSKTSEAGIVVKVENGATASTITMKVSGIGGALSALPVNDKIIKSDSLAELEKELSNRFHNETKWTGRVIPQKDAAERWPKRSMQERTKANLQEWKVAAKRKEPPLYDEDTAPVAIGHFEGVQVEGIEYTLGDYVEVTSEFDYNFLGQITELFETVEAQRLIGVHWYYNAKETRLAVEETDGTKYCPVPLGEKLVFRAANDDNCKWGTCVPVDSLEKKVKVVQVLPGMDPPEECDYYWHLCHNRKFFTFSDPPQVVPASKARFQAQEGPRKINIVDLYCGAGGMSFIDQRTDAVELETKWAVDFAEDMCDTFRVNYPSAEVFCQGVDEWLALCKRFKNLSDMYPDDWKPEDAEMEEESEDDDEPVSGEDVFEVEKIIAIKLAENARRHTTGQGKGALSEPLTEHNSWLEFKIRWKGYGEDADTWEKRENLLNCEKRLARYVQETRRAKKIPIPGDVDMVMGGPPCQGVSGLNRHAAQVNVLEDPRNRQVLAFYDIIAWFQPSFVLMENVLDIFKKSDGIYVKFAVGQLVSQKYQCRTGIIPACDQGVPQGRYRAFLWGAKSGCEQLPAFPEPSHQAIAKYPVPLKAQDCIVTFSNQDAYENAFPPVVIGDMLSDLPPVNNFSLAERLDYLSGPKTPYQMWLRRDPPSFQRSREDRAKAADEAMGPSHKHLNDMMLKLLKNNAAKGLEMLGRCYFNNRDPQTVEEKAHYASQTWKAYLESLPTAKERERALKDMEARKTSMAVKVGKMVKDELDALKKAKGPLRDHRALTCNVDDYLRCAAVPKFKGANFRQMKGVVVNDDGKPCVGHSHAPRRKQSDKKFRSSCKGGGTYDEVVSSREKTSRVDHHDKGGWRGVSLKGCAATTEFLDTGDLLCPRWCITYQKGNSNGRHGCFGRFHETEIQPTVVGRAEPHNLRVVHPTQDRVVSIRENARCQGFPDYFALVGKATLPRSKASWVRSSALNNRYIQMGNAVCPAVASALGRCLVLAAVAESPTGRAVIAVPDPSLLEVMAAAKAQGLKFYAESHPSEITAKPLSRQEEEDGSADEADPEADGDDCSDE